MTVTNVTNATDEYRARAYKLLSLAERASDPGRRVDLLLWTSPVRDLHSSPSLGHAQ
ncbi:MAG TPA: hypothetical protein VN843_12105 [Anaerolineales bacterium]|nr:hypothetical protein [Anaerolineales bacterium]